MSEQESVQEPVALISFNGEYYKNPKHLMNQANTPEAQREWVGLTDEERDELWYKFEHMKLMRAVEAKLKDKNA